MGRNDEAIALLEEAIPLLERVGDLDRLGIALANQGEAHRVRGDLSAARDFNERGLEVSTRGGNPSQVAFTLVNLAEIELSLGQWEQSRGHLERADEVLATLPSENSAAPYIPLQHGHVLMAQGKWDEADIVLHQGLAAAAQSGDRQALEFGQIALAELEVLRGEPAGAIARLAPLAGREGSYRVQIETILARALLDAGQVVRAEAVIREPVDRARTQGDRLGLADALRVQGMVLRRQGREEEAAPILAEGLGLARELPYPYAEARILEQMGQVEEALAIFRRLGAQKDVERLERGVAASTG